jgi:hypothetical protein
MMRIPSDDPITIREDPRGLESIQLEEITDLKNPRVPSEQIRSSVTIPTQPEVSRTLGETGVPNPIFDLITIYDDEQILEVSLITPVPITEEKESKKASTPSPDALVKYLLQSDHEVECVLDIELLDLSRNPKDNSRDELGSYGQKEEVQKQEIDTSTTDDQVSTEPTPGSSSLANASPTDEQQMEVEPSEHMKQVQEPTVEQIHTARSLGNTLT